MIINEHIIHKSHANIIAKKLKDRADDDLPVKLQEFLNKWFIPPKFISREELKDIAKEKNGGKLSISKTQKALESNSEDVVRELTSMAFAAKNEELRIRLLVGLSGVRVPTASAILAWTNPKKFGVIDVRVCRIINYLLKLEPTLNSQSEIDWLKYHGLITEVSKILNIPPMEVDRRLYHLDKYYKKEKKY